MVDLKIELTKLYSLHKAATLLDHAVREVNIDGVDWRPFSPSRFVYSYFAFNSLYSFDWDASVRERKAMFWEPDANDRRPKEIKQIKALARFCCDSLDTKTPAAFENLLSAQLHLFSISDPISLLMHINPSNESNKTRNLREALPENFAKISSDTGDTDVFYSSLAGSLGFIQAVRNNIFHGSKSRIKMQDSSQQSRLLIYTAVINSVNGLFFEAIVTRKIGWKEVLVDFEPNTESKDGFGYPTNR